MDMSITCRIFTEFLLIDAIAHTESMSNNKRIKSDVNSARNIVVNRLNRAWILFWLLTTPNIFRNLRVTLQNANSFSSHYNSIFILFRWIRCKSAVILY